MADPVRGSRTAAAQDDARGAAASRPAGGSTPWPDLSALRPLALGDCRRVVVVAPHPRDEIRAAGGLLRRLSSDHVEVDVLCLTDPPAAPHPGEGVLPDVDALLDALDLADPDPDLLDDGDDDGDDEPGHEELAAVAAYRALDLGAVRHHRLGLPAGSVAAHESDVVAAVSEIVGHAADPGGLCVLAPWSSDGGGPAGGGAGSAADDHAAAGRAAEAVCAAYRVRLVRWLDQAWTWAAPGSSAVPWVRARQVELSATVLARKGSVHAAPGPREVFLV